MICGMTSRLKGQYLVLPAFNLVMSITAGNSLSMRLAACCGLQYRLFVQQATWTADNIGCNGLSGRCSPACFAAALIRRCSFLPAAVRPATASSCEAVRAPPFAARLIAAAAWVISKPQSEIVAKISIVFISAISEMSRVEEIEVQLARRVVDLWREKVTDVLLLVFRYVTCRCNCSNDQCECLEIIDADTEAVSTAALWPCKREIPVMLRHLQSRY